MTRVVVVGDALIDELRDDTGVREFVGGAALNVAVGLAAARRARDAASRWSATTRPARTSAPTSPTSASS